MLIESKMFFFVVVAVAEPSEREETSRKAGAFGFLSQFE